MLVVQLSFVTNHRSFMPSPLGEKAFNGFMQYGTTVTVTLSLFLQPAAVVIVKVYCVVVVGDATGFKILAAFKVEDGDHK